MDWLTPGLSARAMMSFDYESLPSHHILEELRNLRVSTTVRTTIRLRRITASIPTRRLSNSRSSNSIYKLYMEAQVNYNRTFNDLHEVTAMALYMQNDYRYNSDLARRYQGVVGRVTYAYDGRYLFEFNAGYNGSENFAKQKRFGFFPSFSAGWRITQEKFMESTADWLSNLKGSVQATVR